MIPGLGGMNPGQMKAMMKQFGIKSEELNVEKIIMETADGGKLVFENPQVTCIDMKGQKSYTIVGEPREEAGEKPSFSNEDVEMVMQQAKCAREQAQTALEENEGDLAAAIASLKK